MAFHYSGVGPPSYGRFIELYPVMEDTLKRSKIQRGEKVIIYTDTKKNKDIIDAFFAATVNLGAEVSVLLGTPRDGEISQREPLSLAFDAMKNAETIIDLASSSWIYTTSYSKLLDQGIRILCNMSDPDTILKMAPRDDIANRAKKGGEIIDKGSVIRVASQAGTDLIIRKNGRPGMHQEGTLEGPGSWDNLPSAQCACAPLEDAANGKLVIAPGDNILTIKKIVTEPITCTLKEGRITKIEGGADAALLRDWFAKWDEPNSYIISHIGFGCDHRAELATNQLMEWESFGGGIMIAFGANDGRFLGGKTHSKSHIDIVLLNSDFYVEDELVIQNGQFVHQELK